ncbi:N-acetylmuramoyl-L-alanine amidase family protein [Sphingosinicella rhizophila]|uniref:N-acetylmuramoyl-L-alanine amidase family protein n=1 Tax=Sphingosinicella rhizophila TaxID=3050082 RepID=UPI0039658716
MNRPARYRNAHSNYLLDPDGVVAADRHMDFLWALLASLFGLSPPDTPPPADNGSITISLDQPETPGPNSPRIMGGRGANRPLVVLDAGHGGKDPGARSPFSGRPEKDVTLAIARAIRDELVASGRVRVALTRDDDRFLVLRDRYGIARQLGADLFISVHADAAPHNDGARGATIYTLSEVASDREAALLAVQENASDKIGGAALSEDAGVNRILIDLAQRESMNISADFASLLRREASAFFPFRPEYHRFASLIVLKAPDVPSILFETGYLTNAVDAAYIQSDEGRKQIALGMRRAIEAHFARRLINVARR